jgi:hypothetical protein
MSAISVKDQKQNEKRIKSWASPWIDFHNQEASEKLK